MAITFAVRGDSIDARYALGRNAGTKVGTVAQITNNVDAGYLSGNNIEFSSTGVKIISWSGKRNTPNGRDISVLSRVAPGYTGAPAGSRCLFPGFYVGPDRMGRIEIFHNAAGNLAVTVVNELGTVAINAVSAGAFSPTSGTLYDLFFTWDGTTTANSFKVYVDGTLLGTGITPTAAMTASWNNQYFGTISFGNGATSSLAVCKIDEIVVWDTIVDPLNVTLVSGAGGDLNGASRTSLVDVPRFEGANITTGHSGIGF